ncbi:Serine/threonine-protein kinase SIK2, partial [Anabarilius grahami]
VDAASSAAFTEFINHSIARMNQQQESFSSTGSAVQALVTQVSELSQQLQQLRNPAAPPTPPVPPPQLTQGDQPEPRLPTPQTYAGEPSFCRAFLNKCSLYFSLQPRTFEREESKVAFVLTLLTGQAALWGTAVWENQDPCCSSFQTLAAEMRRVFDRAVTGRDAAQRLAGLKQRDRTVADYSIEFRTLAAECNWNEEVQWDVFLHGLADRVQREIYVLDLPQSLNGLVDLALRVDTRINRLENLPRSDFTSRGAEARGVNSRDTVGPSFDTEPMQVGRARLSREERERRRSQGLCIYYFGFGNFFRPGEPLTTWCGSPPYAAPEVFEGQQYEGPQLDIWSMGVVLYVLVCGTLPFDGPSLPVLRQRVLEGRFRIPYFMSEDCEHLIRKMLVLDPARRLSLSQIKEHRWMVQEVPSQRPVLYRQGLLCESKSGLGEHSEQVLRLMHSLGIDQQKTIESLQNKSYNHFAAIYYLLVERLKAHRSSFPVEQRLHASQRRPSTVAEQTVVKTMAVPSQACVPPQAARHLRSPVLLQSTTDTFTFPQTPASPDQTLMEENVATPKSMRAERELKPEYPL